jgi:hypothetical protein
MRKVKLATVLIVFVFLVLLITIVSRQPSKGTLILSIQPANAKIIFADGSTAQNGSQKLLPGIYKISTQADGYIDTSTSVKIIANKSVALSIRMKELTSNNQVKQTLENSTYKSYVAASPDNTVTILKTQNLYNNSWIVATVKTNSDPAVVVLKQAIDGSYVPYLGPGTSFNPEVVSQLPPDVRTAIRNGYVGI